ncbi:MAG: aminopeptidase [Lachnospiraceae bacterium]|nr:aminopeptidase [Lachnospiraceae bacterium]
MMELFLLGLLVCSTITGLLTEAVKRLCEEHGLNYYANTLAGIDATVVSILVGVGYVLFTGSVVTAQVVISIIALIFMSWLCAMVGYDKVVQAISQFKTYGKDE